MTDPIQEFREKHIHDEQSKELICYIPCSYCATLSAHDLRKVTGLEKLFRQAREEGIREAMAQIGEDEEEFPYTKEERELAKKIEEGHEKGAIPCMEQCHNHFIRGKNCMRQEAKQNISKLL